MMAVGRARTVAVGVVLACAVLWGLWWWPVSLLQAAGLGGAWVGLAMTAGVLPLAAPFALARAGGLSPRAVAGAALAGLAVGLYGVAAYHTEFLRAVLLFYLAPIWSTLIETAFFGRRWRPATGLALGLSLAGVLLITRGGLGTEGIGALGDWLALASGLAWSAVYVAVVLAGTMWGAFRLAPAAMSYLLSVEILSGVASATLILGEPFGLSEGLGAACIIAAAMLEVTRADDARATGPRGG